MGPGFLMILLFAGHTGGRGCCLLSRGAGIETGPTACLCSTGARSSKLNNTGPKAGVQPGEVEANTFVWYVWPPHEWGLVPMPGA